MMRSLTLVIRVSQRRPASAGVSHALPSHVVAGPPAAVLAWRGLHTAQRQRSPHMHASPPGHLQPRGVGSSLLAPVVALLPQQSLHGNPAHSVHLQSLPHCATRVRRSEHALGKRSSAGGNACTVQHVLAPPEESPLTQPQLPSTLMNFWCKPSPYRTWSPAP